MWDDFEIGNGPFGTSAITVYKINSASFDISENKTSYWITVREPNIGMRVTKDTTEGKKITEIISNELGSEVMHDYLLELSLRNMDASTFINIYKTAIRDAHERGYRMAKKELREWLEVD